MNQIKRWTSKIVALHFCPNLGGLASYEALQLRPIAPRPLAAPNRGAGTFQQASALPDYQLPFPVVHHFPDVGFCPGPNVPHDVMLGLAKDFVACEGLPETVDSNRKSRVPFRKSVD